MQVRSLHGTSNWFKMEKGVQKCGLLSCCLFNQYAEHIMRNARLGEIQTGIKTDGRNINNLRYVDDTTLMAESEEKLKEVKEEVSEKAGLNLNIKKLRSWHRSHHNCAVV